MHGSRAMCLLRFVFSASRCALVRVFEMPVDKCSLLCPWCLSLRVFVSLLSAFSYLLLHMYDRTVLW